MVALIRDEKEAVAPIVTKHTLRGRVEGKSVMFKVVGRSLVFEASELNDSNSFKRVSTKSADQAPARAFVGSACQPICQATIDGLGGAFVSIDW